MYPFPPSIKRFLSPATAGAPVYDPFPWSIRFGRVEGIWWVLAP